MTTKAPTQTQLLTLTQWFSPAFPVGAYSYSHGLEWAIEAGEVTDQASLQAWMLDVLELGGGRSDAVFLAASYDAEPEDLPAINAQARAFAPSKERLFETTEQGAAFARAVGPIWGDLPEGLLYPVAIGVAARVHNLSKTTCVALFLQAFVSNLASVGMRLIPLGQTQGHQVIHALAPVCERIAAEVDGGDLAQLSGTTFLADIATMKHETQYSRTFRT